MKVHWEYFWRYLGFHLVWYLLSPIAWLITVPRGFGGFKAAHKRMKMVYDALKKKYVLRPILEAPIRQLPDDDIESITTFADKYKMTRMAVYQIWIDNHRRWGMTLQQLEAMRKSPA